MQPTTTLNLQLIMSILMESMDLEMVDSAESKLTTLSSISPATSSDVRLSFYLSLFVTLPVSFPVLLVASILSMQKRFTTSRPAQNHSLSATNYLECEAKHENEKQWNHSSCIRFAKHENTPNMSQKND